jgi:hypothetical protein
MLNYSPFDFLFCSIFFCKSQLKEWTTLMRQLRMHHCKEQVLSIMVQVMSIRMWPEILAWSMIYQSKTTTDSSAAWIVVAQNHWFEIAEMVVAQIRVFLRVNLIIQCNCTTLSNISNSNRVRCGRCFGEVEVICSVKGSYELQRLG